MAALFLVNYYFRPMLVTHPRECDMRANQWEAFGKVFLNPKTSKQHIFRCRCDPGTCIDRKENDGRGQKCKEPGILTILFRYEINHL